MSKVIPLRPKANPKPAYTESSVMRSSFVWWLKRHARSFKHKFKTDWQFRIAVIALPIAVAVMALLANNSYWFNRFLQP